MFIKRGIGQIIEVIDEKNLTEEQKKAIKDSKEVSKESKISDKSGN
jgi:hypothetical protein